jgi:hypothetical protein
LIFDKLTKKTMRGGARVGGGRPSGSKNKRSIAAWAEASAEGLLPVQYMLKVLRDEKATLAGRQWAAHAAAPYIHPRPAPEQRRITIALPDTSTPQGVGQAISAVLAATGTGEIAPSEGRDMIAMLESRLKAIEIIELEARIAKLEARDRENRFTHQSR